MNDHPVRDVFADGFRARSETDATLCETVRPLYLFKVQQTSIVAVRCQCLLTSGALVCRKHKQGVSGNALLVLLFKLQAKNDQRSNRLQGIPIDFLQGLQNC